MEIKKFILRILRYSLFFLFLGHYGCITLFTHAHHIENGVIIVHSHPFRSGSGTSPISHGHTSEGYVLIHFLTTFLTTAFVGLVIAGIIKTVPLIIRFQSTDIKVAWPVFLCSNGLRAPPLNSLVN